MRMRTVRSASRTLALGGLLVASVLIACSDAVRPGGEHPIAGADAVIRSVNGTPVPYAEMQEGMARLARQVAVALSDPPLRQRVYQELQASPFRENKLHFRSLLIDDDVGLRRAMADAVGVTEAVVMAALDSVVDLEFYMPVNEHWAAWEGDANLLVASFPDDDGSTPRGFNLEGRELPLSAQEPPSTPALVLTPAETDFSVTANSANLGRLSATGATADATGGTLLPDSAWFLTYAWLPDDYEGWGLGDPEFELHTWQQQPSGEVKDEICAGAERSSPYFWDMNSVTWTGSVALGTQATLDTAWTVFQVWEDDTDACTSTGGRPPKVTYDTWDTVEDAVKLSTAIHGVLIAGSTFLQLSAGFMAAGLAWEYVQNLTHDDWVGNLMGPEFGCWPPREDGPARYLIKDDTASGSPVKGDAMINPTYGIRDPLCALSVDIKGPNPVYNCDPLDPVPYPAEYQAEVFGGDGSTISYSWKEDGVTRGSSASYQLFDYSVGTRRVEVLVNRGSEEATDVMFVDVLAEDPEESEICMA